MQITRRDALMGATAAAVATGATVAPLAIKAVLAGVPMPATADVASAATAVSASVSDARIFALVEEHERAEAEMEKAGKRWFEAVMGRMPAHLRNVPTLDPTTKIPNREFWDAAGEAWDCPEVKALGDIRNGLRERCHELVDRLALTEATTLEGVRAKMRFVTRPERRPHNDVVCSAAADLERLVGGARP